MMQCEVPRSNSAAPQVVKDNEENIIIEDRRVDNEGNLIVKKYLRGKFLGKVTYCKRF
jgi:hypothetical protein